VLEAPFEALATLGVLEAPFETAFEALAVLAAFVALFDAAGIEAGSGSESMNTSHVKT
jgi:acid phosphatase family membrane protein YuiD